MIKLGAEEVSSLAGGGRLVGAEQEATRWVCFHVDASWDLRVNLKRLNFLCLLSLP